ncbi:MAG: FkbM family methyltransferase [Candidatus Acidiferrales bacterium]
MPPLPARKQINGVTFEYDLAAYRGLAPMYFGSYALLVVEAMKRSLFPGGVFIDVGSNIGYLSAIAAGFVGPEGQVHAFEPVLPYFERLRRLAEMNPGYNIFANPCGAGDTPGHATIYVTREAGQNTVVPRYKSGPEIVDTQDIPIVRLDAYIEQHRIERVSLIKIDAEGFEFPVLKGLQGYFAATGQRPPIVCEIAPRAYPLMGEALSDLSGYMRAQGYAAFDLIDASTPVDITAINRVDDVLFLAPRSA